MRIASGRCFSLNRTGGIGTDLCVCPVKFFMMRARTKTQVSPYDNDGYTMPRKGNKSAKGNTRGTVILNTA